MGTTSNILEQISQNALLIQIQIQTLEAALRVEGCRIDPEIMTVLTRTASVVEAEATTIRQLTKPQ